MPDPCFCRLELVASNPARLRFTYLGYICSAGVVTDIDVLLNFQDGGLAVAPPGTPMPNRNDPCTCDGVPYCGELTVLAPAPAQTATPMRRRAVQEAPPGAGGGWTFTPCHEEISPNLDILAQWNARTHAFPNQMVRLVMLGRREHCSRYRIVLVAYVEDNQCLADYRHCFLDDGDIDFIYNGAAVLIGTVGNQVGPFWFLDRLTPPMHPHAAPAKAEAKPAR